jgi:hypothetical protein
MNTNNEINDLRELTMDETDGVSGGSFLSDLGSFVLNKVFDGYLDSVRTPIKESFQHIKDVRGGKKPA